MGLQNKLGTPLHAAFVGITHYANPERMPALHAFVCLWMFRIDHA
jgi:hypothetical protein